MATFSISDFTRLINTHIKAHEELDHHLTYIEGLFNFMLAIDFSQAGPAELRAQLLSMSKLIHSAKSMNEALQAALFYKVLPQLADIEKQAQ